MSPSKPTIIQFNWNDAKTSKLKRLYRIADWAQEQRSSVKTSSVWRSIISNLMDDLITHAQRNVRTPTTAADIFLLYRANAAALAMPAVRASCPCWTRAAPSSTYLHCFTAWISCAAEQGMGQHEDCVSLSKSRRVPTVSEMRLKDGVTVYLHSWSAVQQALVYRTSNHAFGGRCGLFRRLCEKEMNGLQLPGSLQRWGWHKWGDFQSPFPRGQTGHLHGRCRSDPDSSVRDKDINIIFYKEENLV